MSPDAQKSVADDYSANVVDEPTLQRSPTRTAKLQLHLTTIFLFLALFLSALDITIVGTALPTIAAQLGANAAQYVWVGSSYALASASSSPLWFKPELSGKRTKHGENTKRAARRSQRRRNDLRAPHTVCCDSLVTLVIKMSHATNSASACGLTNASVYGIITPQATQGLLICAGSHPFAFSCPKTLIPSMKATVKPHSRSIFTIVFQTSHACITTLVATKKPARIAFYLHTLFTTTFSTRWRLTLSDIPKRQF